MLFISTPGHQHKLDGPVLYLGGLLFFHGVQMNAHWGRNEQNNHNTLIILWKKFTKQPQHFNNTVEKINKTTTTN